jgi:hypothetical protein
MSTANNGRFCEHCGTQIESNEDEVDKKLSQGDESIGYVYKLEGGNLIQC